MIEPVVKRIIRDSEILKHKDDHSMFEAFINSQDLDSEFKDLLLKEATIIMGEI